MAGLEISKEAEGIRKSVAFRSEYNVKYQHRFCPVNPYFYVPAEKHFL